MSFYPHLRVSVPVAMAILVAACSGPSHHGSGGSDHEADAPGANPPARLDAEGAREAADAAVLLALEGDTSVTVHTIGGRRTLDGAIELAEATVEFASLKLREYPFEVEGAITVTAQEDTARIDFTGAPSAPVILNGRAAGELRLGAPIHPGFLVSATTRMLLVTRMQSRAAGSATANACSTLTVTPGANGSIVIDGACTIGNFTLDFDNVKIDLNGSITGKVIVTDNGNPVAEIEFLGSSVKVTANGQTVTLPLPSAP